MPARQHGRRRDRGCVERRECVGAGRVGGFGEAEIEHLDAVARGERDVRGLQIAVNDPSFVGRFERLRNLPGNRNRLIERQRASLNARCQRLAVDELQHQKPMRSSLLEAVDTGDVLMVQRGEDLRLAPEPREPFRILGDAVRQRFQRDLAGEPGVLRPIHLAHAACAEQADDLIGTQLRSGGERHRA
jgi:hypothetical protein